MGYLAKSVLLGPEEKDKLKVFHFLGMLLYLDGSHRLSTDVQIINKRSVETLLTTIYGLG